MNIALRSYLQRHADLSENDITAIDQLAESRSLRRGENILNSGEVCRHKVFVVRGLLRTYGTAENGNEFIVQFSAEENWTLDAESYDKEIPSKVSIGAIEPSEVLLWTKANFESLRYSLPGLRVLAEKVIARNVYHSRQRILMSISATPEEKYNEFVKMFPEFLSRLPLHSIAAYLGISLKTLTRIRHAQLQVK